VRWALALELYGHRGTPELNNSVDSECKSGGLQKRPDICVVEHALPATPSFHRRWKKLCDNPLLRNGTPACAAFRIRFGMIQAKVPWCYICVKWMCIRAMVELRISGT
jgi:hypothetical protein